jgi:hypothetical protein
MQVQQVITLLGHTLQPNQIQKSVTSQILSLYNTPGFAQTLLSIVGSQVDLSIRVQACIQFKNVIRSEWTPNMRISPMCVQEKTMIQDIILRIFASVDPKEDIIVRILDSCIIELCNSNHRTWRALIPFMCKNLNAQQPHLMNRCLRCLQNITDRYHKYHENIDDLQDEIMYALDSITKVYHPLLQYLCQHIGNPTVMNTMSHMVHIYHSLTVLDLHDHFSDHIQFYMTSWCNLLQYPVNDTNRDTMIDIMSTIMKIFRCHIKNYNHVCGTIVQNIVMTTWKLVTYLHSQKITTYDHLLIEIMHFMNVVAAGPNGTIFIQNIPLLFQQLVHPSLSIRECDVSRFNDDPDDYMDTMIRYDRDLNRCTSTQEFVESLMFRGRDVIQQEVLRLTQESMQRNQWSDRIITMRYLPFLTPKQQQDVFQKVVVPELKRNIQPDNVIGALVQSEVILASTRLCRSQCNVIIPLIIPLIVSSSKVVPMCVLWSLDQLMQPRNKVDLNIIGPYIQPLLNYLFKNLNMHSEHSQTIHTLNIIRHTIRISSGGLQNQVQLLVSCLGNQFQSCVHRLPHTDVSHALFKVYADMIIACPGAIQAIETDLFPRIHDIVKNNCELLIPYVPQLICCMIRVRPGTLPTSYTSFYQLLVHEHMYRNMDAIPFLIELLNVYGKRLPNIVQQKDSLSRIMSIVFKLIQNPEIDHQGFEFLRVLITHVPIQMMHPYLVSMFQHLMKRTQASSTKKFIRCFVMVMSMIVIRYGPAIYLQLFNPHTFQQLIHVWCTGVRMVHGKLPRRLCSVALMQLNMVTNGAHHQLVTTMLQCASQPIEKDGIKKSTTKKGLTIMQEPLRDEFTHQIKDLDHWIGTQLIVLLRKNNTLRNTLAQNNHKMVLIMDKYTQYAISRNAMATL